MSDFESFTRDKIAKLRLEADALEKILREFQATQARIAGAARRSGGDQPRAGAFGVVMEAIKAAGVDGLTLDEMIGAAASEGYPVKRPTLRSQLFQAKSDGLVVQIEPGRYRSSVHADFAGVKIDPPQDNWDDLISDSPAGKREVLQPARTIRPQPSLAPSEAASTVPRESFSADLDDEIPF